MITQQDKAESILKNYVGKTPDMSDEIKKIINQTYNESKKSRDDFKKAIDEAYSKMESFFDHNKMFNYHEHAEKMFSNFLNDENWIPQDVNKAIKQLASTYNSGRDEFKKYIGENMRRVESLFSVDEKPKTKTKKKK